MLIFANKVTSQFSIIYSNEFSTQLGQVKFDIRRRKTWIVSLATLMKLETPCINSAIMLITFDSIAHL